MIRVERNDVEIQVQRIVPTAYHFVNAEVSSLLVQLMARGSKFTPSSLLVPCRIAPGLLTFPANSNLYLVFGEFYRLVISAVGASILRRASINTLSAPQHRARAWGGLSCVDQKEGTYAFSILLFRAGISTPPRHASSFSPTTQDALRLKFSISNQDGKKRTGAP